MKKTRKVLATTMVVLALVFSANAIGDISARRIDPPYGGRV